MSQLVRQVRYERRWRFYPARWPWGTREIVYYAQWGGFVYGDE